MKPNYILIPAIVAFISLAGSWFTNQGMKWYQALHLPDWTPPGAVIGIIWTAIFVLSIISILFIWNRFPRDKRFRWIVITLVINGILNLYWSFLFFYFGFIGAAFLEAVMLDVSVIVIMILAWPKNKWISLLFLPYALWVALASYLNYIIWTLN